MGLSAPVARLLRVPGFSPGGRAIGATLRDTALFRRRLVRRLFSNRFAQRSFGRTRLWWNAERRTAAEVAQPPQAVQLGAIRRRPSTRPASAAASRRRLDLRASCHGTTLVHRPETSSAPRAGRLNAHSGQLDRRGGRRCTASSCPSVSPRASTAKARRLIRCPAFVHEGELDARMPEKSVARVVRLVGQRCRRVTTLAEREQRPEHGARAVFLYLKPWRGIRRSKAAEIRLV